MSATETPRPTRRRDLVIRSLGDTGRYVVKDPQSGDFFQLGEQEYFLLTQLDGRREASAVCAAFEEQFGDALSEEDLNGFLQTAAGQGLLETGDCDSRAAALAGGSNGSPRLARSASSHPKPRQSILHWRKSLFDPDRLLNWLEPKVRIFWTSGFLAFSAGSILLAIAVVWLNGHELAGSFQDALRLETIVWLWLVTFVIITLHEFAHGLTCKHYGGEVHEVGFLLMFFMPCFFCNVSDAWLFRERSKRLWVTFAGGYFELFLWSIAVFMWRVTLPGSFPNYLAFLVVTCSGIDTLFNFNPLIKLDGYYLLSDWLEIPNLHKRGEGCFKQHLRRWLWGAPRQAPEPHSGTLFVYGLASWAYGLAFLSLMLWGMFWFLGDRWGVLGMSAVTLIGLVSTRSMLKDTSAGEARRMLLARHKRLTAWLAVIVGVIAAFCLVKIDDRVSGKFSVRPAVRAELRAAASGFVKAVRVDEGDRVSAGSVVAVLDIPDLASRIAEKQAEIREAQAQLKLLEIGTRPERLAQQRERVARATTWRDLGQQDLDRLRLALAEELANLEMKITACRAEFEVAQKSYERAATLARHKTISAEEVQQKQGNFQVVQARLEQAESERRARQARGTLEAEAELASRQHQVRDAESALKLLAAGSRPEQIEAQRAQLTRLNEEANYLEQLRERLTICSRVAGIVVTPRLKEKIGQYVHEGDILGVVEEPTGADVEISLAEQDVGRIQVGHAVALKVRALPFETFQSKVERIAPAADQGEVQSTVVVYCGSGNLADDLRPGMTGYARITTGRRPVGEVIVAQVLRYVRTEFWFCW